MTQRSRILKQSYYLEFCIMCHDRVHFDLVDVHGLTESYSDSSAACPRHKVVCVGGAQGVVEQVMKSVVGAAVGVGAVTAAVGTDAVVDILVT